MRRSKAATEPSRTGTQFLSGGGGSFFIPSVIGVIARATRSCLTARPFGGADALLRLGRRSPIARNCDGCHCRSVFLHRALDRLGVDSGIVRQVVFVAEDQL